MDYYFAHVGLPNLILAFPLILEFPIINGEKGNITSICTLTVPMMETLSSTVCPAVCGKIWFLKRVGQSFFWSS